MPERDAVHVVFFAHTSTLYGASRSLLTLIEGLRRDGVACTVILRRPGELMAKLASVGATAIVGYTGEVDWLDAAACDLMILPMLVEMISESDRWDGRTLRSVMKQFAAKHSGFVDDLGLTIATATWTSHGAAI